MFSDEEKDIICEFSLENTEKLKIALGAHASYEKIYTKIIREFSLKLEEALKKNLPDCWQVNNEIKNNKIGRWSGLYIHKENWGAYQIGIQPQSPRFTNFYIGVGKEKDTPEFEDLYNDLVLKIGKAERNKWWDWHQPVDSPYNNWTAYETLLRIYEGNKESESLAVKHFTEQIMRIQAVASELIDEHVAGCR